MSLHIRTNVTVEEFYEVLKNNEGLVLVKFSASWCVPCQKIKHTVDEFFSSLPADMVTCFDLDVDFEEELFSFLRRKRLVSSIPSILCYKRGNVTLGPDDSVSGVNVNEFFNRCTTYLRGI
jgi:thioredoxin 1